MVILRHQGNAMVEMIVALVVFLFPLAYSPGPGNGYFAVVGARFGLAATVPATTGYHLATLVVTVAIGLGFLRAVERLPAAFSVVQYAGAAYVLWLAWRLWRAGVDGGGRAAGGRAGFPTLRDGAVLLLLNPKAYLIISLMFSQFLNPDAADPLLLVLLISTVFTLNNLVAFTAWSALGDRLGRLFRDQASARRLNAAFALTLAGVAVWMAIR